MINVISDTAFLSAAFRAKESARSNALFFDPFAERLAGDRATEIARMAQGAAVWECAVAVRTRVIDDLLCGVLSEGDVDVVVNVGAGLDTRPYRLAIPSHVRWIEADAPAVLDYKTAVLAPFNPQCSVERTPLDILDAASRRRFLTEAFVRARCVLVIAEGILMYLARAIVVAIARELRETAGMRWWIVDHPTSTQLQVVERAWNLPVSNLRDEDRFAPEDAAAFFRACGWEAVKAYASADCLAAFGRVAAAAEVAKLIPFLPAQGPRKMHAHSGYALLQPT